MPLDLRKLYTVLVVGALSAALVATVLSDSIDSCLREIEEEAESRQTGRSEPIDPSEWLSQSVMIGGDVTPSGHISLFRACSVPLPGRMNRPASLFGRLYDHSPPAC